jgi:hypothetical protein
MKERFKAYREICWHFFKDKTPNIWVVFCFFESTGTKNIEFTV